MEKKKRIIFSAGGTGGHLFPAQAVAGQLLKVCDHLFVGGKLSQNRFFDRDRFAYADIDCATFSLSKPWQLLGGGIKILRGVKQSRKILADFAPDLVVGFGSFYTLPLLLAASLAKIPFILHEQNGVVGKVNKLFSRYAQATAITFPESASMVRGKSILSIYPLRQKKEKLDPWEYFNLDPSMTTIVIFGGSQGAIRLNELFLESVPHIQSPFQVLHLTGRKGCSQMAQAFYHSLDIPHVIKEFDERVDLALQIADLAITRGGAGTIAELIDNEVPAILIPFPHAAENHQFNNSLHFAQVVGGGEVYLEKDLDGKKLAATIETMLQNGFAEHKEKIQHYKNHREGKPLSEIILGEL